MNNLNIRDLAYVAEKLLKKQSSGEEFMLSDVHKMTRQAYEDYREDPVIRQVAFTIEKMAERSQPGATITQAEISNIYNEFVRLSSENKFRSVLGHLLLNDLPPAKNENPEYVNMTRVDASNSSIDTSAQTDKMLTAALASMFGGSTDDIKAYDETAAQKGIEYVGAELESLGFDKTNVKVMGGNHNTFVYAIDIDTNKGLVTVAIPINLTNDKLVLPSTFVADDHLEELTRTNLQKFVTAKSENSNFGVPNVSDILTAVGIIAGYDKKVDEDSFSKTKEALKDSGNLEMSVPNLYVDKKYVEPKPDIDTHQDVEMPKELAHLAHDFEDDLLEAVSTYGKDAVEAGRLVVARELVAAGFKNAQVKYGGDTNNSVVYCASINTPKGPIEIEVPVDMQIMASGKYAPMIPTYFAYDGVIEDFTAPKLQRFAVNLPVPSSGNVRLASAYEYMKLPELKNEILKSASDNDYVECETILNLIEDKFSEEDYKNSVADYQYILMAKANMASQEQHKCSKMIPAGKGSIYARCGHYLVPMSDVSAGPNGECILKKSIEREKLNPQEAGGASMSSYKVFMS